MKYVCINSFPKSGNTWLRSIFSHLLFDGSLQSIPDKHIESPLEAPSIRRGTDEVRLYKSHDAVLADRYGDAALEHAFCIYIYRHPLDVFLSQLNYMTLPPSRVSPGLEPPKIRYWLLDPPGIESVLASGDLDYFFGVFLLYGTLMIQFREADTWQRHATSWLRPPVPTVRIRYEDLAAGDRSALVKAAELLGKSPAELDAAMAASAIVTKPDGGFFWKQTPGLWKEVLPKRHARRFGEENGKLLRILGYDEP